MPSLNVHIIGAGYGETVVIEFPDCSIGVIDPYCSHIIDDATVSHIHPIIRFINNRHKNIIIRFVLLTHPHTDHCLGVSNFLNYYSEKIGKFYIYDHFPSEWFRIYLSKMALFNIRDRTEEYLDIKPGCILFELDEINEWCKYNTDKIEYISDNTVLNIKLMNDDLINIRALAPSSNILFNIRNNMKQINKKSKKRIIDEETINRHDTKISKMDWNELSTVILLGWKKVTMLLSGDANECNWERMLINDGKEDIKESLSNLRLVKISHHGSYNEFNRSMKKIIDRNVIGILTPFDRIGKEYKLPSYDGMKNLLETFDVIYTTCRNKSETAIDWNNHNRYDKNNKTSKRYGLPAAWTHILYKYPEVAQCFNNVRDANSRGTIYDYVISEELIKDILREPMLINCFKEEIMDDIRDITNTYDTGKIENLYRVSISYNEIGIMINEECGESAGKINAREIPLGK